MDVEYLQAATTYVLFIKARGNFRIKVGRIGRVSFFKGYYVYIGSAKKRMKERLNRHFAKNKRLFWHIDYLLDSFYTTIDTVLVALRQRECLIASFLLKQGYGAVESFGSSDCRCCSHLFWVKNKDSTDRLKGLLERRGFYNAGKGPF